MIAFNFNIHFQDELSLDDGVYDTAKEDIYIVKNERPNTFDELAIHSEYTPMSGREACYGAEVEYALCQKGCRWGVRVKGVLTLTWTYGEQTIEYVAHEAFTPELLQFWVLHTILPMKLSLEKRYEILHVGAVELNDSPILFSAESFGGKSTMTDYFIRQGHTLLSDDTLGVDREKNSYMAVASYPFHRPYREAESLGYRVTNVQNEPKPIKAVYLLEQCLPDDEVKIEAVKGIEKYRALHFAAFINFDFQKSYRFTFLSKMAETVPLFKVSVPWDLDRLNEVYKTILEHST